MGIHSKVVEPFMINLFSISIKMESVEDYELKWKSLVNWENPKYSAGVLAYTLIIFVYGKYISESTVLSFAFQILLATYILIRACRFALNEGKTIEEQNEN